MKRRHAAPQSDKAEEDFAEAVLGVYASLYAGKSIEEKWQRQLDWAEIYRAASGLAELRKMIDKACAGQRPPEDLAGGLGEAIAIIGALTTGGSHPIWKFISGMKSARFRPGRQRPGPFDEMGQDWIVGVVRALRQAGHRKSYAATVTLCEELNIPIDRQRIMDWDRRNNGDGPDRIAIDIIRHATAMPDDEGSLAERILQAVRPQTTMLLTGRTGKSPYRKPER